MRINNISKANLNFTRAIEIRSNTNPCTSGGRIDNATMNVINVLQNKPSIYDRETSKKISTFLRAQIGDISKNRVYPRRIGSRVYIFTGEEAKLARGYDLEAKKEKEALERKFAQGITTDMDITERIEISDPTLRKYAMQNIFLRRDEKMLKLVEDGGASGKGYSKPYSKIELEMDKRGRLKEANFYSFESRDGKSKTVNKTLSL